MTDVAADLALAFAATDAAAELALAHYTAGVTATSKADGSPVTPADRAVERLLRDILTRARPEDALLGEELGRLGSSKRLWVLDPIDGTGYFARGDPNWRIQLTLQINGCGELAVVTSPALGQCWWATRGGGAFASAWPRTDALDQQLKVSDTASLTDAVLHAVDDRSRGRLPAGAGRIPASPLPLVELVYGEVDAFLVERYHTWDHAPWILLVQEAGGRFTDPTGGQHSDRGGGLYSNAALHEQLLAHLHYPPPA